MTDKQILEEVYRRLKESDDPHGWKTNPLKDGVTSFIEQEWQKQDEAQSNLQRWQIEAKSGHNDGWTQKHYQDKIDERADSDPHRGLDISEDGTVTRIR